MDWFAVASYGVFPTPTPTDAERAVFAVSYGLLSTAPAAVAVAQFIKIIGSGLKKLIGG